MKLTSRRRQGFTLIELLVVISIIAVLAAIIMPVYSRAQEQGRQASCMSQLHAVGIAMKGYHADFRRYPGEVAPGPGGVAGVTVGGMLPLVQGKYLSNPKALICPDDANPLASNATPYKPVELYSSYNVDADLNPVYNYYGLDPNGLAVASGSQPIPPDPANMPGVNDSEYPALFNPNAPDETVITHCVHHRSATGNQQLDLILHLGGNVEKAPSQGFKWMVYW
jgi:prepilin-type N-terminal cleavage/methylation domain-containing protein